MTNSGDEIMKLPIEDRITAGRALGRALKAYAGRDDVIVLALPRGGVPVAYEVARAIGASLDLMLVRKLGTPGQKELAMGAIATGGALVLNEDIIRDFSITREIINRVAIEEQKELERRQLAYRGTHPLPKLEGLCVILVDDGLATGATMRAAISALRQFHPVRVVVAVPVAPMATVERLEKEVDQVVCLETPEPFMAIGKWYQAFPQVSDAEVKALLSRAWQEPMETAI